jgi:hypothetical protein
VPALACQLEAIAASSGGGGGSLGKDNEKKGESMVELCGVLEKVDAVRARYWRYRSGRV